MKQEPFILIITGITTAGKSTLLCGLKRRKNSIKNCVFHDMDENGLPSAGLSPWRLYRIEELLYESVQRYEQGKSTVLCGVIYPHEIIDSEHFSADLNLHYLLLQNSKRVFGERVDEKIRRKPEFSYMKSHKKHFLKAREHLYNEVASQLRHFVLDSGRSSRPQLVKEAMLKIGCISGQLPNPH